MLMLGACATLTTGSSQKIRVTTDPAGADCTLTRNGVAIGRVNPTPGEVSISRDGADILATCTRAGAQDASSVNRSGLEAMTFGNILIGGLIGVAIDAGTNANRKYDGEMHIVLAPASSGGQPQAGAADTTTTGATPAPAQPTGASPAPAAAP